MRNVKSIENPVEPLPPMELAEFRRWFAEFDGNAWDRQIEQDAASGKLDQLAIKALATGRTAARLARSATMYAPLLLLLAFFAQAASANDTLWQRLKTEPNLVVLMRHTHAAGGNPVAWDETGGCAGELMLTSKGRTFAKKIGEAFARQNIKPTVITSPMCRCRETAQIAFGEAAVTDPDLREIGTADPSRRANFERKAQSLIASHRGASPLIFISHRPNIDLLSLELIDEGVLLVAQASARGEVTVLGTLTLPP